MHKTHDMKPFFLILSFIPLLLWAQDKPFPSDNNGHIVFAETVPTGLTQAQNYAHAKAWIEGTFPGTLLQESPETGCITAKGSLERFPVSYQDAQESIHEKAHFTIILECKDLSLRYQIRDISLISVTTKEGSERETDITHGEHYMNIQYYCNLLTDEERKWKEIKETQKGKKLKEEMERYNRTVERYNQIIRYEEEIDDAEYQYFMDLIESLKRVAFSFVGRKAGLVE